MKTYNIIYTDPPWYYPPRNNHKTAFGRGADSHYPLMKDQEILDLDVGQYADTNCALLMWATGPRLPLAVQCFKSWGFRYSTIAFSWVKTTKAGTFRSGPGYYTCSNVELVLLGVRGRMPPADKAVKQVYDGPISKHSKKPDEIRNRIVTLFGDVPRLEMFARQTTPGWDVWGDEVL